MRGFLAARDVALARADDRRAELMRSIGDEIMTAFRVARGQPRGLWEAVVALDRPGIIAGLAEQAEKRRDRPFAGNEWVERAIAACCDRDWDLPAELLEAYVAIGRTNAHRPLEAQALRGVGLFARDAGALRRALAAYESMGARPCAARVRCELGRLTNDETPLQTGLAALRELGDQMQLARFER